MLNAIIAATTQGSAEAVKVTGGMSLLDSNLMTAIFSGVAAIIGALGTLLGIVLWGRRSAAKKRPLDSDDVYVRQCECQQHRAALSKRIDELGPALERIFKKLSENDRKSEERSMRMHARIDPLIERTAANSAEINLIKDLVGKEAK